MNHMTWSRFQQKYTNSFATLFKNKTFYLCLYPFFLIIIYIFITILFLTQNSQIYKRKHFTDKKWCNLFIENNKNKNLTHALFSSHKVDYGTFKVYIIENVNKNCEDVILFHASKIKPEIHMSIALKLAEMNYNVIIPFYRGYGPSLGQTNEINIMIDMQCLKEDVIKRCKNVYGMGQSLGCAAMLYFNMIYGYKMKKMVLENPFLNLRNVVRKLFWQRLFIFFVIDGWENDERIRIYEKYSKNEIMLIYSSKDELIDYEKNGKKLMKYVNEKNKIVKELKGAKHSNGYRNEEWYQYIKNFYKI